LYNVIAPLRGKWLLSFSDDTLIKELFGKFNIKAFTTYSGQQELLISNFPTKIPIIKEALEDKSWLKQYENLPVRSGLGDLIEEMSESTKVTKRFNACDKCKEIVEKEKSGEFTDENTFKKHFDYLLKTETEDIIKQATDFVENSRKMIKSQSKYKLLEYSFKSGGSDIPLKRWFLVSKLNNINRGWEFRDNPLQRNSTIAITNDPETCEFECQADILDKGIIYFSVDRNDDKESILMKFSGNLDGAWKMEQDIIGHPIFKFIRRRGKKWVVVSEGGKVLGEHDKREDAVRQLQAIEANKKKMTKEDLNKPFAGYKNFADCVNQNKNRKGIKDVKAYCGYLKHRFEKEV